MVVAASLLAGACAQAERGDLRFGLAQVPQVLDPRYATDAASARINRLLYEPLVAFDDASRPVPALARWDRLSPTHYRFHLGDGRRQLHNGGRLDAQDVKATYDSVLAEDGDSPHRAGLDMVEEVRVVDEETVDFHLNRGDPLFPGRLTMGILPAELIRNDHLFGRRPVGSGPFRFVAWPEEDQLILQRRRDDRRFMFIRVGDATVRLLKLLRGEIDMIQNDLPPELITYARDQSELRVQQAKGSNFTYLGFNLQDPLVGKLSVRRAIAHAVDRQAIIEHVMGGAAHPANALLPADHWAGHPGLDGYAYDPAKARQLLAEAGYGGEPVAVTYKTSSNAFRVRLATVIQHQLAQAGLDVELKSYDWGTFYGDIKAGQFQMYSLSWVGIKTPDIFRYAFHSEAMPPEGANRGRFDNRQADQLIERAETASTLEARARHYHELQALLLDRLPYVPLWYEDHVFIARPDIRGYDLARDGNYDGLVNVERR